ncbi:oxidation resistance protein 1, partial [Cladochytrium tenue]
MYLPLSVAPCFLDLRHSKLYLQHSIEKYGSLDAKFHFITLLLMVDNGHLQRPRDAAFVVRGGGGPGGEDDFASGAFGSSSGNSGSTAAGSFVVGVGDSSTVSSSNGSTGAATASTNFRAATAAFDHPPSQAVPYPPPPAPEFFVGGAAHSGHEAQQLASTVALPAGRALAIRDLDLDLLLAGSGGDDDDGGDEGGDRDDGDRIGNSGDGGVGGGGLFLAPSPRVAAAVPPTGQTVAVARHGSGGNLPLQAPQGFGDHARVDATVRSPLSPAASVVLSPTAIQPSLFAVSPTVAATATGATAGGGITAGLPSLPQPSAESVSTAMSPASVVGTVTGTGVAGGDDGPATGTLTGLLLDFISFVGGPPSPPPDSAASAAAADLARPRSLSVTSITASDLPPAAASVGAAAAAMEIPTSKPGGGEAPHHQHQHHHGEPGSGAARRTLASSLFGALSRTFSSSFSSSFPPVSAAAADTDDSDVAFAQPGRAATTDATAAADRFSLPPRQPLSRYPPPPLVDAHTAAAHLPPAGGGRGGVTHPHMLAEQLRSQSQPLVIAGTDAGVSTGGGLSALFGRGPASARGFGHAAAPPRREQTAPEVVAPRSFEEQQRRSSREERASLLDLAARRPPVRLVGDDGAPIADGDGLVLLTPQIADALRPHLPPLHREATRWRLVYSLDRHGISINTMYRQCEPLVDEAAPALLVVRDDAGSVFGAFASDAFRPRSGFYGNGS